MWAKVERIRARPQEQHDIPGLSYGATRLHDMACFGFGGKPAKAGRQSPWSGMRRLRPKLWKKRPEYHDVHVIHKTSVITPVWNERVEISTDSPKERKFESNFRDRARYCRFSDFWPPQPRGTNAAFPHRCALAPEDANEAQSQLLTKARKGREWRPKAPPGHLLPQAALRQERISYPLGKTWSTSGRSQFGFSEHSSKN